MQMPQRNCRLQCTILPLNVRVYTYLGNAAEAEGAWQGFIQGLCQIEITRSKDSRADPLNQGQYQPSVRT